MARRWSVGGKGGRAAVGLAGGRMEMCGGVDVRRSGAVGGPS